MSKKKVTFEDVVKESPNIEWSDISERTRTYVFPNKSVTIKNTIAISVSKSGGHRIVDANNTGHYIPPGWVHLHWTVLDGTEAYRF